MTDASLSKPFATAIWSTDGRAGMLKSVLLVLAGTALIAVAARVQVPMVPVPMTLQTLAVLLIGMAYGWRLGGATVAAYLMEGALGLPVFASGGGVAYFAGPTAGYLFGFLAAAMLVGRLAQMGWDRSLIRAFAAAVLGTAVIYLFGVAWLAAFIGPSKALAAGMIPFLAGDLVKAALAAATLPAAWKILNRRG